MAPLTGDSKNMIGPVVTIFERRIRQRFKKRGVAFETAWWDGPVKIYNSFFITWTVDPRT